MPGRHRRSAGKAACAEPGSSGRRSGPPPAGLPDRLPTRKTCPWVERRHCPDRAPGRPGRYVPVPVHPDVCEAALRPTVSSFSSTEGTACLCCRGVVPRRLGRMRHPPPITSRSNLRVKALRAAAAGRASAPGELTALEGEHLLAEAAAAGVELDAVFLREGDEDRWEGPALRGLCAREHFVLSRDVFDSAVGTATPQGIAGLLAIPVVKPASTRARSGSARCSGPRQRGYPDSLGRRFWCSAGLSRG